MLVKFKQFTDCKKCCCPDFHISKLVACYCSHKLDDTDYGLWVYPMWSRGLTEALCDSFSQMGWLQFLCFYWGSQIIKSWRRQQRVIQGYYVVGVWDCPLETIKELMGYSDPMWQFPSWRGERSFYQSGVPWESLSQASLGRDHCVGTKEYMAWLASCVCSNKQLKMEPFVVPTLLDLCLLWWNCFTTCFGMYFYPS